MRLGAVALRAGAGMVVWKVLELPKVPVICIIDDDPSVREAMEGLVRSLGYSSATFSSAEEYLQSDHVGDSSCLIVDLRMPGMSGADLQDLLIADGCETPIIFMTASRDEGVRRRVLNAGALGFLRKPIDDRSLIDCLENALTGRQERPLGEINP
jgi:FixJ family two-component response regulator